MKKSVRLKVTALIVCLVNILSLFSILAYADDEITGDLRWDFIADTENFETESKAKIDGVFDGAMRVTSLKSGAMIRVRDIHINPKEHKYLSFRVKNPSESSKIEFDFITAAKKVYKIYPQVVANTSEFCEYEVDITKETHDGSVSSYDEATEYNTLRILPVTGADQTIDIDYVILTSHKSDEQLSDMVENITICGNNVNFDNEAPVSAYFEEDVYDEYFKALASSNINVEFKKEITDGVYSSKITEAGSLKIIDINTESSFGKRSFRIVCKEIKRVVNITIDKCEIDRKKFSFEGKLTDEKNAPVPNTSLSCAVYENGKTDIEDYLHLGVFITDENGIFKGSLTIFDNEKTPEMFEANVVFDVKGAESPYVRNILYINNLKVDNNIAEMKKSSDKIFDFMNEEENKTIYEKNGVWLDIYNSADETYKNKMNDIIEPYRGTINSSNCLEASNCSILSVAYKYLSVEEIEDLLCEIDNRITPLEVNGKSFNDEKPADKKTIVENIQSNNKNGFSSYEDFKQEVKASMLVCEVNNTTYTKLKDLLLTNVDLLEDNLTELSNEGNIKTVDNAMKEIALNASKTPYKSTAVLVSDVKKALKNAKEEASEKSKTTEKKSSGGSGGGGYSIPVTKTEEVKPAIKEENKTDTVEINFNDLGNVNWAEKSINSLYEKGIVNGVSKGVFEPNRNISREEFIKMLLCALNIKADNCDLSFNDVKKTDWFAPYISKAVEKGIVNGVSKEKFGVGMNITREDMATIIYRSMKNYFDENDEEISYSDADKISDYAISAVAKLSAKKIVNGKGNNNFEPKANATRAEAAVIIYRCLEVVEK